MLKIKKRTTVYSLLITAVILLGSFYVAFQLQNTKSRNIYDLFAEAEKTFTSIANVAAGSENRYIAWRIADQKIITVIPEVSMAIKYPCNVEDTTDTLDNRILQDISNRLKPILINSGFTEDENNHHVLDDREAWGFVKDSMICEIYREEFCNYDPDPINNVMKTHKPVYLSCSSSLKRAELEQVPILADLNYDDGRFILNNEDQNNSMPYRNWAKLDVGSVNWLSGHFILIKNENEHWKEVYSGQENPSCDLVRKEKIPFYVAETCYENNTTKPNIWNFDGI